MNESVFQQPTPEQLAAFVDGNPLVIDEIVHVVLPQLSRWALRQYSNLPPQEVQSVVNQVIAEICLHHARYNPRIAKFTTYVINLIQKRLAGLHEALEKIKKFENSSAEAHEKSLQLSYNQLETPEMTTRIVRDQFFRVVAEQLEGPEKEFFTLLLAGESHHDAFVAVLERYVPVVDPTRQVKNLKEQLIRKLRTIARDQGYGPDDLLDT